MTLETNKVLGGIGAILLFIGVLPLFQFSSVIALVGAVLVLVGLYGVGNYYREPGIFKNAIIAVIIGIIGAVVIVALALTVVLSNVENLLVQIYPGWKPGDWTGLQGMTPNPNVISNLDFTTLMPLITGIISVAIVAWVVAIIAAFFAWRSLKIVTAKSTIGLFGTAGLLLLIGAFLAVILIGVILMWIATFTGYCLLPTQNLRAHSCPATNSPANPRLNKSPLFSF